MAILICVIVNILNFNLGHTASACLIEGEAVTGSLLDKQQTVKCVHTAVGKHKVGDISRNDASRRADERETPIPGSDHIRDFIEEAGMNPVRRTYGFKGTRRVAQM
nr:protein STPG4-like [Salvelinus alpinus]